MNGRKQFSTRASKMEANLGETVLEPSEQIPGAHQSKPVRLSYEAAELWYPVHCWMSICQRRRVLRDPLAASQEKIEENSGLKHVPHNRDPFSHTPSTLLLDSLAAHAQDRFC